MAKKKKKISGTVTITLTDYTLLSDEFEHALALETKLQNAATELEIFLSYLCSRIDILPFISKYNMQSQTSKIIIEDGKAKIKMIYKNE